jgi:two-component system, LytTR family, response regulator
MIKVITINCRPGPGNGSDNYIKDLLIAHGYKDFYVEKEFQDRSEVLDNLHKYKPEVVFCDLDMEDTNVSLFMDALKEQAPKAAIICISSCNDLAVKAFEISAMDYIIKPFTKERFDNTMKRIGVYRNYLKDRQDIKIQCFSSWLEIVNNSAKTRIKWRTKKARELFTYLLYKNGKKLSKHELIDTIFEGASDEKKALNNLYVTVYYIRNKLEEFGLDTSRIFISENYTMDVEEGLCDYVDFDNFLNKIVTIDGTNIESIEKMLPLYNGIFLEEEDYPWLYEMRETFELKYEDFMLKLADYYIFSGEMKKAEAVLQKFIGINPLSDEAHNRLLEIYIEQDNKEKFLKQYKKYVIMMKEEFLTFPDKKFHSFYKSIVGEQPGMLQ